MPWGKRFRFHDSTWSARRTSTSGTGIIVGTLRWYTRIARSHSGRRRPSCAADKPGSWCTRDQPPARSKNSSAFDRSASKPTPSMNLSRRGSSSESTSMQPPMPKHTPERKSSSTGGASLWPWLASFASSACSMARRSARKYWYALRRLIASRMRPIVSPAYTMPTIDLHSSDSAYTSSACCSSNVAGSGGWDLPGMILGSLRRLARRTRAMRIVCLQLLMAICMSSGSNVMRHLTELRSDMPADRYRR